MRSRCMSLLPRTTLHSDSEQYVFIHYIHHLKFIVFSHYIFTYTVQPLELLIFSQLHLQVKQSRPLKPNVLPNFVFIQYSTAS
jgi:hypothetical protein